MNIFDAHISGSLSVSSSAEISGDLNVLGTLSGSFKGDGSQITNIPASGVTGLNLTQIADGSATASISSVNGLIINTDTKITGALKLNDVDLGTNNIVSMTLTDGGGKYYVNGVKAPRLSFIKGFKYRIYFNNNETHPLLFSLTSDGEHNGGTRYTTGITTNSDPFYVEIDVTDATATTFYYWCDHHVGMGNSITVYSDFLHGQSNIGLINVDTTTFATTGSNNFTNIQITSGSLVVTGSVDVSGSHNVTGSVNITGSITLNGQAIGTGKLDETTFQAYTSSNDGRLFSIENSTSSYNTFTSSIDTRIKNEMSEENVISGSIQVEITGTTGYSTFSSSISTSIDSLSSSLNSSIGSLSSSVATTTSGLSSSVGTMSSSFSSLNDTQNNRLTDIETSTSSLNSFTGSINTTIKNKLDTESVISGSLQVLITGTTGYSTFSSSISTSIGSLSSSLNTTISNLSSSVATTTSGLSSSIGSLSSSVATTTLGLSSSVATTTSELSSSVGSLSSSVATTTSGLSSSIGSLSSSVATTTSELSSSVGSLSSSIATTNLNQNNRLDSIEGKTGSYATTGSNIFQGNQTITGSLYVSQNLIVQGESSLENITASAVSIGTNIVVLNTDSPAFRYAGISVFDSGSTNITSSLLYDSLTNQWKFKHTDTGTNDASVMLFGPLGNDIDNAPLLDGNYITKVENNSHGHHLTTSSIFDNGTKVSINSNTEVTGTLKVTGNISSPNITAIETSTGSLNTFTSSLLTAIELTGSNLTVRGNLLVKGTTTNVNTSTLDVDNNLINLNGAGAANAGLRVKDTTGVSQISGSLLWDATNDYWIAGQLGSEQRLVRETEFNTQVTRINNVETSTGSLNSFTSSINTTIKSKLNSDGVISGSVQVNHNSTTNYDANQHVDHTSVSISAGNGLSGGGTIASTRTLTLDTGSVHFLDGVKKELNTEGVISGSSQILLNSTIHSGSFFNGISVVSGSAQIIFSGITSIPSGLVSGSSQITGITNSQLVNAGLNVGTTPIGLGRAAAAQTLTGVSIDGNAATVTGGVYLSTNQTITGVKTFQQQTDTTAIVLDSVDAGHATRFRYKKNGTDYWSLDTRGSGESDALNLYRYYSGNWYTAVSWNHSNGNATFSGTISATNLSGTNTGDQTTITGNAGSATILQTARTIGGVSFNGSANIDLPGVNTSGNQNTSGNAATATEVIRTVSSDNEANLLYATIGSNDFFRIRVGGASNAGFAEIATADDASEPIYVRQYSGTFSTLTRTATILDGSGNTSFPGTVTAPTFSGALSGNASTVTNGVYTNGSYSDPSWITALAGSKISGAVANATSADQIDGIGIRNTNTSAVAANTLDSNGFTYVTDVDGSSTNLTGNSTDGALYSQIYSSSWQHQIYGDYRTGIMYVRGKNSGTWQSWKRVALSSATTFSNVSSVTFNHTLGTANVTAQVFDTNGDMFFPSNIRITSTQVILTFASNRSGRLVVTG